MTVEELLRYIVTGGAGVIASYLMDTPAGARLRELVGNIAQPVLGTREVSRYIAMVLSGVLTVVAVLALAALGYEPWPADLESWLNVFLTACYTFLVSQVVHARRHLAPRA